METKDILKQLADGNIDVDHAYDMIKQENFDDIGYAMIDYQRKQRTGVSEVIYGAGKTGEQIAGIVENMIKHGVKNILGTRVSKDKYLLTKAICEDMQYDELSQLMYIITEPEPLNKGKVLVACAGTSDLPVANEAVLTARFLGNEVVSITDVGVAGIHRLLAKLDIIQDCNVIIAVAGMEGALASVIGGLTDKPVIAVPTSVGYGANFQGLSALLAMLNSCASGISVVNIDNGFGAGYMAHSINCLGGKR